MSDTTPTAGITSLPTEIVLDCLRNMDNPVDVYHFLRICRNLWYRAGGLEAVIRRDIEIHRQMHDAEMDNIVTRCLVEDIASLEWERWYDVFEVFHEESLDEKPLPSPVLLDMIRTGASAETIAKAINVYSSSDVDQLQGHWGIFQPSALVAAVMEKRPEVVQMLLDRGCDVHGTKSYLKALEKFGGPEASRLPAWKMILVNTDTLLAALEETKDESMALYLIEKGHHVVVGHLESAARGPFPKLVKTMLQLPYISDSSDLATMASSALDHAILEYNTLGAEAGPSNGQDVEIPGARAVLVDLLEAGAEPTDDLVRYYLHHSHSLQEGDPVLEEVKKFVDQLADLDYLDQRCVNAFSKDYVKDEYFDFFRWLHGKYPELIIDERQLSTPL